MSIIQNIRDKGAKVSVILIALALIGFILTDYVRGKDRSRGASRANSVGSVNGHNIGTETFAKAVEQNEANLKQQGYPEFMAKQQAIEQAWEQQVSLSLLEEEFSRLGMGIGKRERGDILFGPNAPEELKKAGTDEKTGQYDPVRAKQQLDQMMKNKQVSQEQKDQFKEYINQLEQQRKAEKYHSLLANSVNFPRWFVEKETADNSQLGKISMVRMLYTDSSFVDSTIKISDKEISDYIAKHKENYKQEESRSINFVSFSAAPTAGDSAAILNDIVGLKAGFDTTRENEVASYLVSKGSPELSNVFYSAADLSPVSKDSILKLAKNGVYGPYLDRGSYILAKLVDSKILPDSVKCRHILVSTDTKNGGFEDSIASKKIDSIKNAVNGGASWADMVQKYNPPSDGSKAKNGEMTFPSSQIMEGMESGNFAKEFGQFVLFDGKPGEKKVVKTSFGYHYIEVLSFIRPETHYKIAYLQKGIDASQQTDENVSQEATNFAGDSKDQKSFDAAYEKTLKPRGVVKVVAENIKRNDAQVQGLQEYSRTFVRNIYAAKKGEVLKPEQIGSNYIVAIVTDVLEEGTQSVAKARPAIEMTLRVKKKAELIKQKAGKITTLEAASAVLGKPIESADSLRMKTGSARFTDEPIVFGATFNPSNKGKVVSEALEGKNGVYVIRVENVSATSAASGSVADQRKAKYDQGKQSTNYPIDALKKAANIKDKRSDIY
jgi:peptidyl-prolyl cis-trans isomerase D